VKQETEAIRGIRLLAASLMAVLGSVYLVFAAFFGSFLETMEIPPVLMVSAGVVYLVVTIGLFANKRLFYYLGVVVPLVWASMGIIHYAAKPDPTEFPFIAAEIIVILCCYYLILHKRPS
jgi:hypothetical protein